MAADREQAVFECSRRVLGVEPPGTKGVWAEEKGTAPEGVTAGLGEQ